MLTTEQEIIEEIVELPTKTDLPLNMIPQLSRLANAYIENVGYRGKVCHDMLKPSNSH